MTPTVIHSGADTSVTDLSLPISAIPRQPAGLCVGARGAKPAVRCVSEPSQSRCSLRIPIEMTKSFRLAKRFRRPLVRLHRSNKGRNGR
jgi:hypothetical protein